MSSIDLRCLILLAASAAVLTGCAGGALKEEAGGPMLTPTQQFAPKVEEGPESLALAVHPAGVSENQRRAIAAFADKYRADDPGELTLRVPQSVAGAGGDNLTPTRMAAQVVTALESVGISRTRVRVAAYDPAADPAAPVVLTYLRYAATIPDCSHTWNNVGATGSNKPTTNFGCSSTANFAAMVADPRDLLRPVPLDPADNSRRQVVLGKYRVGELTSSAKDEQASGVVSKAVK